MLKLQSAIIKKKEAIERKKAQQDVRRQIDSLWVFYDRDRSGELDFQESKEFLKDLVMQLELQTEITDHFFKDMFILFDSDNNQNLDRNEMFYFICSLLGILDESNQGFEEMRALHESGKHNSHNCI